MINRYPGFCARCQERVEAGKGDARKNESTGKWQVFCNTLTCEAGPVKAPASKPAAVHAATANVGDMSGIIALFDRAKAHLKVPAIVLGVPGGHPAIRVNIAGPTAKVPGSLTVLEDDRDPATGNRRWLGRVLTDGTFQAAWEIGAGERKQATIARLEAFAADPSKIGAEDGRLHGRCCFCRIRLTDERSTAAGYGATCASHWGLAWGKKPLEFAGRPNEITVTAAA